MAAPLLFASTTATEPGQRASPGAPRAYAARAYNGAMMLTAKQYRDAADLLMKVSGTQHDRDTRAALLELVAQFLTLAERMESEAVERSDPDL
jgi:hypothetical protein